MKSNTTKVSLIQKVVRFFKDDLWHIKDDGMSRFKYLLLQKLRVLVLAIKEFEEDGCLMRASALTYFSLISIVPVLAMVFGIAQGFGLEEMLEDEIRKQLVGNEDVVEQLLEFTHSMLSNTGGGLVAGIGIIILLWSVMKVMGHIETSFNAIWGVTRNRGWIKKITEYMTIMLVAPIMFIVSSSATVFITSNVVGLTSTYDGLKFAAPILLFLVKCIPYAINWLLFTFLYVVMPNTKVNFKSALIGGIIAGSAFALLQWAYVSFQVMAVNYSAIYGSFAALPLFLIWLNTSWLFVLVGAEIAYSDQNIKRYEFEAENNNMNARIHSILALLVMKYIVKNFEKGLEPLSLDIIANKMKIPGRAAQKIVDKLISARLINKVENKDDSDLVFYQPALDIHKISIAYVLNQLNLIGVNKVPISNSAEFKELEEAVESFTVQMDKSKENTLLYKM